MSNFSLWGCPHGQCVPSAVVTVTRSLGSVTFLLFKFQFAGQITSAVGGGAHLNYCMIATGNHRYFDSLRDAPRPGGVMLRFCIGFRRIRTAFCRAVEGAGPYNDIRRTSTNCNLGYRLKTAKPKMLYMSEILDCLYEIMVP